MPSLLGRGVLALTERAPVRRLFTESRPGRALARRFVAGETLDEAMAVAEGLNARGARVSLDHLGEHVTDRSLALVARDDYLACLDRVGTAGLRANISVKLTQLGLGLDDDLAAESLATLARRAGEAGTSVSVDMEESRHTEATIEIYAALQAEFGNLGLAIQSYLRRTPTDLDRLTGLGGHLRLCKGAYQEPPDLAFTRKADVDAAYDRAAQLLMGVEGVMPAIATHDTDRIDLVKRLAPHRTAYYEFQMLYGVRPTLQDELLGSGYPLRIYVPYGSAWYPYLTRRLAERPANVAFFLRAALDGGRS